MTNTRISFGGQIRTVNLGGYLRDSADVAETTLQSDRSVSDLPERVDLRSMCTPVENQGTLGSCTANAAVGALELLLGKSGQEVIDLSRLFVYYNTRRLRGDILSDTGATIAECMAALLAYGAPDERLWPTVTLSTGKPSRPKRSINRRTFWKIFSTHESPRG